MSWWDAKVFCDMLGLDFVPRDDLFTRENDKWVHTELAKKKLRKISGIAATYSPEHSAGVGYVWVIDPNYEGTSIWYKNDGHDGTGTALCR